MKRKQALGKAKKRQYPQGWYQLGVVRIHGLKGRDATTWREWLQKRIARQDPLLFVEGHREWTGSSLGEQEPRDKYPDCSFHSHLLLRLLSCRCLPLTEPNRSQGQRSKQTKSLVSFYQGTQQGKEEWIMDLEGQTQDTQHHQK